MVARSLYAICFVAFTTLVAPNAFPEQINFESLEPGPLPETWDSTGAVSVVKPGLNHIGPFGGFKEGGTRALALSATSGAPAQVQLADMNDADVLSLILRSMQASSYLEVALDTGFTLGLDFAARIAVINGEDVVELPAGLDYGNALQLVLGAAETGPGSLSLWLNPSEVDGGSPIAVIDGYSLGTTLTLSVTSGEVRVDTIEWAGEFTALVPSASTPGSLLINGAPVRTGVAGYPTDNGSVLIDHASDIYAGNDTVRVEAIAAPNHVLRYLEVTRNGRTQIYYDTVVNLRINGDATVDAVFGLVHESLVFEATGSIAPAGEIDDVKSFNDLLAAAYRMSSGGATGFENVVFGAPISHEIDQNQIPPPSGEGLDLQLQLKDDRTIHIRSGPGTMLETVDEDGRPNLVHRAALRWDGAMRVPLRATTSDEAADGVILGGASTYEFLLEEGDQINQAGLVILMDMTEMGAVVDEERPLLRVAAHLSDGFSTIEQAFDPAAPEGLHHAFYSFEAPEGLFITGLTVSAQCGLNRAPTVGIDALGLISRLESAVNITAEASGGGAVQGGGNYSPGATVTLFASPDDGNVFLGWTTAGEPENPLRLNASESATVTAEFGHAPQSGGTFTAAFSSVGEGQWTAESKADWLASTVRSQDDYVLVDVTLSPNLEADPREATIELRHGDEVFTHSVIQVGWAHEILGGQTEYVGEGWVGALYWTSWIGEIEVATNQGQPFLRTDAHGWWYVSVAGEAMWAFDFASGHWLWIHPATWPTVYSGNAGWMTWSGTSAPRWFFSYTLNDWLVL